MGAELETIGIQAAQRIVIRLIKEARAVDLRELALLVRADIDQLERPTALNQSLQLRSRQLANRRRLACSGVVAQGLLILIRPIWFGQSWRVSRGASTPRGAINEPTRTSGESYKHARLRARSGDLCLIVGRVGCHRNGGFTWGQRRPSGV